MLLAVMEESGTTVNIKTCPLISTVQRIGVYETKARLYVVGSNRSQQRFRVLKIDRTEPQQLIITDDGVEYSRAEIRQLMRQLDEGNRPRSAGVASGGQGLTRRVSAFGLVGFVRFTEGYYMIVITQRRRVAMIGANVIYKIEDTKMIYIPHVTRKHSADEQRYVRLFHSVGMGSSFYFSYDLTHTLQYNLATPQFSQAQIRNIVDGSSNCRAEQMPATAKTASAVYTEHRYCAIVTAALPSDTAHCDRPTTSTLTRTEAASDATFLENRTLKTAAGHDSLSQNNGGGSYLVAYRPTPAARFMWNSHLLAPAADQLSWQWQLSIVHGYLGQALLSLHGRSLLLTLIGRRSSFYAGTRFLKRGANYGGDVANEVETEQIVGDAAVTSLQCGLYSSHVQLRGSVPCHWFQDPTRIPKPPIQIDLNDPFHLTAGKHMNDLLGRYGVPVVVVNLVKKHEKRSHETLLHKHFRGACIYLNRFVPPAARLRYTSFDMARVNKLKRESVMVRLTEIADAALHETGVFLTRTPSSNTQIHTSKMHTGRDGDGGVTQTGVVRVNCVDCLDRTNTAQFAVGKSALAMQLYLMGVLASPLLPFDTECVSILEQLYEDHGDILALQYGGSQLVHRIRTYRKTANWGAHGSDIVQTMQRYYSNTFSDADKQNAINLFLGVFVPATSDKRSSNAHLWLLPSDHHLHLRPSLRDVHRNSLTKWWSDSVMLHLPHPANERNKQCDVVVTIATPDDASARTFTTASPAMIEADGRVGDKELVDIFTDCHRLCEFSPLSELLLAHVVHSVRENVPSTSVEESPFAVRWFLGRSSGRRDIERPNMASQCSSSAGSDGSETGELSSSSADMLQLVASSSVATVQMPVHSLCYHSASAGGDLLLQVLPSFRTVYGAQPLPASSADIAVFRRYCSMNQKPVNRGADGIDRLLCCRRQMLPLVQRSQLKLDSSREVASPQINRSSLQLYREFSNTGMPSVAKTSLSFYRQYTATTGITCN